MRDDRERLQDIAEAIDRILSKISDRSKFDGDELLHVWALHHLQIIGEATRSLSPAFKQEHPDDVWAKATGLRHILVHHYFEIDPEQIWKVIEQDLPTLRERVATILGIR